MHVLSRWITKLSNGAAAGYVHDLVALRQIRPHSVSLQGRPTAEYSWFKGYAWTIAVCANCGTHLVSNIQIVLCGNSSQFTRREKCGMDVCSPLSAACSWRFVTFVEINPSVEAPLTYFALYALCLVRDAPVEYSPSFVSQFVNWSACKACACMPALCQLRDAPGGDLVDFHSMEVYTLIKSSCKGACPFMSDALQS